jgi:two-component system, LuxR family, sensor kinase FixL
VCIAAILQVGLTLFEGRSPILLFLLIVPILWLALREHAQGAALALAFAQAGLVIVLALKPNRTNTLEDFEVMMVVLSLTSLLLAGMSAEHQAILLRAKDDQLALTQRLRTRFTTEVAAMLGHELNQPLTAMKMYLGVLTSAGSGAPVDTSGIVSQLNGQLDRTEKILRSVRDLAEVNAVRPEQLDVEEELMAVTALLRDQARRNGVKLETRINADALSVTADPVQFQQAIYNLVLNAIESLTEAHHPGTVTVLVARTRPDQVEVSVSDTGPGFPKDMLATGPTMFRTSKPYGTGVGLSLVRSIAESHGGTFSLNNLEHGAAVRFTMLQQSQA